MGLGEADVRALAELLVTTSARSLRALKLDACALTDAALAPLLRVGVGGRALSFCACVRVRGAGVADANNPPETVSRGRRCPNHRVNHPYQVLPQLRSLGALDLSDNEQLSLAARHEVRALAQAIPSHSSYSIHTHPLISDAVHRHEGKEP